MNDLALSNLTILLAIGGFVVLLILIQVFLAIQHDKAVEAAGPLAEIDALRVQINGLKDTKNDYETDLDKFRKTLAEQAEKRSEMDHLVRRIEELQLEWASFGEKRKELSSFNVEAEGAQIKRIEVEQELKKAGEQLTAIKEKLIEKEQLEVSIEGLKLEKNQIDEEVRRIKTEVSELKQLKADEEHLKKRVADLEREASSLEGSMDNRKSELETLQTQVVKHKTEILEHSSKLAELRAALEAHNVEFNSTKNEKERITAELEVIKAQIQKEKQKSGKSTDPDADPLEELKVLPPVILDLQNWDEVVFETEIEALQSVKRRFQSLGLVYHDRVLHAFHTTMKTNESTQLAVLAGISGTGKSQLPRQYASGMGIGFLQVPVQPRWDSPQDLMGFYNYIEGKFKPTDMARALWSLDVENNDNAIKNRMLMVMLDEMNLARIEYYFSDFLSRLESRPSRVNVSYNTLRKDAEIELEIPNLQNEMLRLFPGYNLLFAGTMNEDETTNSLSDKVIDRANVMRFGAPNKLIEASEQGELPDVKALNLEQWERWIRPISDIINDSDVVNRSINQLAQLMQEFGRPFGHRLGLAMKSYIANYPKLDGIDRINVALADQVEMRLLPKLRGIDVEEYGSQLSELIKFVKEKLNDLQLAQAIEKSVEASQRNSQFTWIGVTR